MFHGAQKSEIKTEHFKTKLRVIPESKISKELLFLGK